ncbi:hypothetical protein OWV82_021477 [Melia azedarach]|uniref:Uncharacterized protein n=1 Tax=Melia azedarach TaxID=155640 RepID=A0ACC1WZW9_MELAZ|nr:hypothetical protein OWV82_021477 [Melia azedarach]
MPPSVLRLSAPPAATAPAFAANYSYNVPSFGTAPYAYYAQSPPLGAQSYAYGVPSSSSSSNNYYQHPEGNQQQVDGARFRKKIYMLVGRLAFGIVTNGVVGN